MVLCYDNEFVSLIVDTIDNAEQNKYFAVKTINILTVALSHVFVSLTINRSGENMQQVYEKILCNKFDVIGCALYYVEAIVFLKLA